VVCRLREQARSHISIEISLKIYAGPTAGTVFEEDSDRLCRLLGQTGNG